MNEAGEALIVVLPTSEYPPVLVQPCEQALNLPSPLVSTQHAAVMAGRPDATCPVRRDQFNAIGSELCIERITVIGTIPDKSLWQSHGDSRIDGSFDKGDFMWTSEAVCMASGRPAASAIAMSFVPLPRLVFPTLRPLFSPPRRCRR